MKFLYFLVRIYWYIFRPKTFGVRCLVTNKDESRVILVRHHYVLSDFWSAIGGGIKKNETWPEAVCREVKEEIGCNIYDVKYIGLYKTEKEYKKDTVYLFTAKTYDENFKLDRLEILEAKWFDKNNLPEKLFISTTKILEKI